MMDIRTKLFHYVAHVAAQLFLQLAEDDTRYHDTWLRRGQKGQEKRFLSWLDDRMLPEYEATGKIPWLKVMGEALIGYIRENPTNELIELILAHPEYMDGFPQITGNQD
jgi:hypothetical protein